MTDKEEELLVESALPVGALLHNGRREYKVVKVIKAGGFGITYKVSSVVMVDNVPVKTFFALKEYFLKGCYRDRDDTTVLYAPTMKTDVEASRADFITEARRMNKLSGKSRNIVRVNEVFEENGTAYYVMEFLDGGDLQVLVGNKGISEAQAISLILPIARAVMMIHEERVLHLDIKPSNIVMKTDAADGSSYPVLIDFGIAKHFDSKGRPTTKLSAKGASEGYAPIEQYDTIARFAPEIDVYALGATLLFMLTGKCPPKSFDITPAIIEETLPKNVSARVRQAIKSAMSRFKEERTPDTLAFIGSLGEGHTLPIGYVLGSGHASYRIVQILGERDDCIIYKGVLSHAAEGLSPSGKKYDAKHTELICTYEIFEYFDGKINMRGCSGIVIGADDYDRCRSFDIFINKARKATDLSDVGDCSYDDGQSVNAEIFSANGTTYYVVNRQKETFTMSFMKKIKVRKRNLIFGICICAIILFFMNIDFSTFHKGSQSAIKDTMVVNNDTVDKYQTKIIAPKGHGVIKQDSVEKVLLPSKKDNTIGNKDKEKPLQYKADIGASVKSEKKEDGQDHASRMALYYVNSERTAENHEKAYRWALKADPVTRAQVMKKLKEMDYPI